MHHVAPSESVSERSVRAPFKYPVRVTIAGERVVRVLSGDLSLTGMFLKMSEPPEPGTVVQLAFEAGGRVLHFAEGEVAWSRTTGERGGFGVRFTRFVHPRASALIEYLCENVQSGTLLKPRPTPPMWRRRWSGLAALAAVLVAVIALPQDPPPPPAVTVDPSLVCRFDPTTFVPTCPEPPPAPAPAPAPAVVKKPALARMAEAPRPSPTVTRTVFSSARPASLTSTPVPSGAARLVTVSRVSGSVRVAIDAVAGGTVTGVKLTQHPLRLVMDVSGIPPVAEHQLKLDDPELGKLVVSKNGKATRLSIELVRHPSRVVQQGDSALISF